MDTTFLLSQLAYQAPFLIVSLAGFVLAVVNRGRCPTPAMLAMVGCGMLFLLGLAMPVANAVMWQQLREQGWSHEYHARMMGIVGLVGSVARAVGFLLVVLAVFAGRGRLRPDRTDSPGEAA